MAAVQGDSLHWTKILDDLLGPHAKSLAKDPFFMDNAFDQEELDILPSSSQMRMDMLVGEARQTLRMIAPYLGRGTRMLEIGGGVGLVYAVLRSQGLEIISLEPGNEGFGDRHQAGLRLLHELEVNSQGWLKQGIENFSPGEQEFTLIFSHFVLEHLPDLDRAFAVMSGMLSTSGLMIHCCPNYAVPFEPHYNMLLIPFRPELTAFLRPGLRARDLWQGLNFITAKEVAGLCARYGLQPEFERGMSARAFERVLADPLFSSRKQGFTGLAAVLQKTGVLRLLRSLPPSLDTPIQFTARKKNV
jgi:SAM-dependent methyltransferase